ncbi:hypothetical protein F5Y10DRAFT_290267 [Nemania abortiva]|nr:hypothetical protein F5Y10DRAFT_290267 [Nemania abortiva]
MGGTYVPPFRRRQAVGGLLDFVHSDYLWTRRLGEMEYRNEPPRKNEPQIDPSDLYYIDHIHSYYWGEEADAEGQRSSTFHSSKTYPQALSYVLLFSEENPRWANERIVFAKSKLELLPEYMLMKSKHGEWATTKHTEEGNGEASEPERPEPRSEGTISSEYVAVTVHDAVEQAAEQDDYHVVPPGPVIETQELNTSLEPEGKDVAIQAEPAADNEAQSTPNTTPSPSSSKYSDAEEQVHTSPSRTTPSPTATSSSKYTDAQEQVQPLPSDTTAASNDEIPTDLPDIKPIDYVSTNSRPIAVFEEKQIPGWRTGVWFAFAGWYKVSRVHILAPKSVALKYMLHQKWELMDRRGNLLSNQPCDGSAWEEALAMEWATVLFEPVDGLPPAIYRNRGFLKWMER